MLPDPAHKIFDMRSNTDVIHVELVFAILNLIILRLQTAPVSDDH